MAPYAYVVLRDTPGETSPDGDVGETMARVRPRAARLTRPFKVYVRGDEGPRTFRRRSKALEVFEARLTRIKTGEVLCFEGKEGNEVRVEVRRVEAPTVTLPDQASSWPEAQKDVYQFVFTPRRYPGARWGGTCNCRETRQGGSLSDHACCHACDVFPATKAQGDDIYRDVMKEFGSKILYISWQVALHYDHLHISTGKCSRCA